MAKVEIYTAPGCPFCTRAKNFLKEKGIKFTEIDVMKEPQRRQEMRERAEGRKTVPQIFINDKGIGGCDDMLALNDAGAFDKLLV